MLTAYLDAQKKITVVTSGNPASRFNTLNVIQNDKALEIDSVHYQSDYIQLVLTEPLDLDFFTYIEADHRYYPLLMGEYTHSRDFDSKYATDVQMGTTYDRSGSVFRVFAPTAVECRLILDGTRRRMTKIGGYFEITVDLDCHGRYYHYEVSHNHVTHNVIDPYIRGISANSKEAMVIDFERINRGFKDHPAPDIPNDQAIIYEAHIRDMTSHLKSGVREEWRGRYLGLTEHTSTKHGLSSGLDYLKELGITHVELMPVNDFVRVDELNTEMSYNWGYDPNFFQVPEGSYATNPKDPVNRILELQTLIQTLHENGMKVILDTVLNHVYQVEHSSFEKLVPGYYFRHNDDLSLSNGTGVGNDFASERLMGRRFITDTVSFWLEYYRIDGCRFDLMGAMDIETIQEIEKIAKNQDREIFLLGEGWDLPTALDHSKKTLPAFSGRIPDIHFFNDYFRDTVKGSNFEFMEKGYVNGDGRGVDRIKDLFKGFYEEYSANMSINYVEVHDNHTLYDRLRYSSKERQYVLESQHQLATALTLLSFGTPFLHAGQEFFRTKYGHGNTYNLSDMLNRMDWDRRAKYQDNIEFVKSLIKFRKGEPVFLLKDKEAIENAVEFVAFDNLPAAFGARITYKDSNFVILINPTGTSAELTFDNDSSYKIDISNQRNVDRAVYQKNFYIKGYEIVILRKIENI